MHLNWFEFALMNNPVRAALQRRFEAKRLLRLGGATEAATVLEVGCGRGVGIEIILDLFNAERVDAFDLDPRMLQRAQRRLRWRGARAGLWRGDVTAIPIADETYDAVFDFGIIHHVPDWRAALAEIRRVLRPGGRFYAEEVYRRVVTHGVWRPLLKHPQADRFDHDGFCRALARSGFELLANIQIGGGIGWVVADKGE